MKKFFLEKKIIFLLIFCFVVICTILAIIVNLKIVSPYIHIKKLSGGTRFVSNSHGSKPLFESPYGYEIWSTGGTDNNLTWYGPKKGGGAAFRAEWNNSGNYLGRVGYFWNEGKPYTDYGNVYCGFNYKRSPNGTAGNFSYIGIYGWSKKPMIEWYIVEDWYGDGIIGPETMGGGAEKMGEFTVDGAVYFIYKATRPAGSGNIEGSGMPFPQYFSVRQTRRQRGTISITEHFKEWERIGLELGTNMYEAKFLVESGGGTGWFDATYIKFYQKD